MPLFTPQELSDWLGGPVVESRGAMAERVVWGWLAPVLQLTDRPDPVPAEVFSWAIELGGIAHENPAGLSSKEMGPGKQSFSLERRQEILAEADQGGGSPSGIPSPVGSFPAALPYPDPTW